MANVKITALTSLSSGDVAVDDVFVIDDISATETKKVSVANLIGVTGNAHSVQANLDAFASTSNANAAALAAGIAGVTVGTAADTETRLNANLDVVQDNVVASESNVSLVLSNLNAYASTTNTTIGTISTNLTANLVQVTANTDAVETRRADNVFFTYNTDSNVVINTANLEPSQNNVFSLGAPDKVWADVYIGPGSLKLGEVTISALAGEGITITGASGDQANVTTPSLGGVSNISAELAAIDARIAANTGVAASNDFVTYTRLDANISIVQDNVAAQNSYITTNYTTLLLTDSVQDNVASAESNVTLVRSNLDAFASSANSNAAALASDIATLSTVDTATGTETRLNANLDITNDNVTTLTTTVDNFGTSSNSNAAALALEDAALQTRLGANVTSLQNEDTGLQARIAANTLVAASNDYVTYTRLNSNLNIVQDNVAAIIDGTTQFTGDVTMQQALTVSGNLYVVGAQVDLGVSSATIDDAILTLSANLAGDQSPPADTGLLFNRGNQTNVFIGFETADDHLHVVFTDSPGDNVSIAEVGHVDIHANVFHADGGSIDNLPFGPYADNDTGIIFPSADKIGLVTGGVYRANLSSVGLEATAVYSDGVELQANDSATLFSARANDFATYTLINANVDVVQDNVATLTTTVDNFGTSSNSNAAALAAEDVALQSRLSTNVTAFSNEDTALQARITANAATAASNDFITYTRLNANVDVVQDNVATLTTTVDNFGTSSNANAAALATEDIALQARITANAATAASNDFVTYTRLNANVDVVQDNVAQNATDITAVETRRTANIAGAVSTITTGNLTASRALVSDGSGKIAVSAITSTELGYLDGLDQNLNSNLVALAAGIAASATGVFPTGDYGLLDEANAAVDSFGFAVADLTIFDMSDTPSGELGTQDLGALS